MKKILKAEDLKEFIRGDSNALESHLECVTKDFPIPGTQTKLHGHFVIVDQNGNERLNLLAQAMRDKITDYAIPRKKFKEAQQKDLATGTGKNVVNLYEDAKKLFTDLEQTGEGGELLLFMLAENFLGLPQLLCKMSLKTDKRDHFKGSDGVYVGVDDKSNLLLYWGESKVYNDIQSSIRECLKSLGPFLLEPENDEALREEDIMLLNTHINIDKPEIIEALKNYLDKHHPQNRKVKYCGVALAAFNHDCYKDVDKTIETISAKISAEIGNWSSRVKGRLTEEKLENHEIHFFCIAISCADKFREEFKKVIGAI